MHMQRYILTSATVYASIYTYLGNLMQRYMLIFFMYLLRLPYAAIYTFRRWCILISATVCRYIYLYIYIYLCTLIDTYTLTSSHSDTHRISKYPKCMARILTKFDILNSFFHITSWNFRLSFISLSYSYYLYILYIVYNSGITFIYIYINTFKGYINACKLYFVHPVITGHCRTFLFKRPISSHIGCVPACCISRTSELVSVSVVVSLADEWPAVERL